MQRAAFIILASGQYLKVFDIMSANSRKWLLFVKMKITGIYCKIGISYCADTVLLQILHWLMPGFMLNTC